jgi:hypothetical protein
MTVSSAAAGDAEAQPGESRLHDGAGGLDDPTLPVSRASTWPDDAGPASRFQSAAWLAPGTPVYDDDATDEFPIPPLRLQADAVSPTDPPRLPRAVADRIVAWSPAVLLPTAIALWASSLPHIDLSRMNDYGLVSVLPARVWVAFAVFMASFVVCWWRADHARVLLFVHVLAFIVMFYGIPALVAHSPRGPIVYRHAGITESLIRTGLVDPRQDAYFNWPAFFMFLASVVKIGGVSSALTLATWATVVVNVLYLPPLLMIMRTLTRDSRLVWGAVLVFYATNWINQDYLAPQSFTYLFYLTVIALVLRYLRPRSAADMGSLRIATLIRRSRLTSWTAPLFPVQPPPPPEGMSEASTGRTAAAITVLILVLFGAATASHQLSPYAIFISVTLLVLTGHCRIRGLPLLLGVIMVAWTIFVAHSYIDGHLGKIATGTGLGQSATANVTQRLSGSDQHLVVVRERLMLSAWVWLMALLGAVYRFRSRHKDYAAAVLGLAPIPLFLLPYGGEVLLRLYFFMLPFVAFFAVAPLVPPTPQPGRAWAARSPTVLRVLRDGMVFGVVGSVLLGASFFARYGNERMDTFSPAEIAAVRELYSIAPLGSSLMAETNYLPWKYQDYEWSKTDPTRQRHKYLSLADEWNLAPNKSVRDMVVWTGEALRARPSVDQRAGFLILSRSQQAHEEILGGLSQSTMDQFERLLVRSGKFQLVYSNPDAKIYARNPGK